uniref:Nudix hydrolase domain-containing protein n=1 Tax=Globisporangium ultimum (strain ATCC 200006 / CBS 805.95 / DAOM BR144) TaxID=431595 RepID=K3X3E0_GLOUD
MLTAPLRRCVKRTARCSLHCASRGISTARYEDENHDGSNVTSVRNAQTTGAPQSRPHNAEATSNGQKTYDPKGDAEKETDRRLSFAQEFAKPHMDATFLVDNYTAPALAAAYQDREYTLRLCAELLNQGKLDELQRVLQPYQDFSLEKHAKTVTPFSHAFAARHLERIRKRLSRLPRQITKAYTQRASVVIPLCTFEGEPSVLFTVRSLTVGKHKGEVCFPGGMVDANDSCIEATCLREMNEEVGLAPEVVQVLGVLRCDWSSVTSITGIAVTPVVGYIGEMSDQSVVINEAEVESLFTVSLQDLMDPSNWIRRSNATPVFTGGPHVIWGLTAYLLDICLQEVLVVGE